MLEKEFCLQALKNALWISKPEILNTDQGAQFTSEEFMRLMEKAEVRISMEGRNWVYDNIFIERLWRTVMYEEVYLHNYGAIHRARERLAVCFRFYNTERLHQSLGCRTPY